MDEIELADSCIELGYTLGVNILSIGILRNMGINENIIRIKGQLIDYYLERGNSLIRSCREKDHECTQKQRQELIQCREGIIHEDIKRYSLKEAFQESQKRNIQRTISCITVIDKLKEHFNGNPLIQSRLNKYRGMCYMSMPATDYMLPASKE